jgi:hypothetical protein
MTSISHPTRFARTMGYLLCLILMSPFIAIAQSAKGIRSKVILDERVALKVTVDVSRLRKPSTRPKFRHSSTSSRHAEASST